MKHLTTILIVAAILSLTGCSKFSAHLNPDGSVAVDAEKRKPSK